jgi:hypothetical protein
VAPVPRSWGPGSDGCFSQKKITPRKPRRVQSASYPKARSKSVFFRQRPLKERPSHAGRGNRARVRAAHCRTVSVPTPTAGGPGPSQLGTGERWVLQPEKDYSSKTPHGPVSILPKKPGRNQCFSGKAPSGNGRPTRDVETGRGSGLLIAGPSPFQPPRQGRGGLPAMRRLRPFAYTRGFSGVLPGRSGRLGEEN